MIGRKNKSRRGVNISGKFIGGEEGRDAYGINKMMIPYLVQRDQDVEMKIIFYTYDRSVDLVHN